MNLGFENSWLEEHLRALENNKTIRIVSTTHEPAVSPGDNYLSSITRLNLITISWNRNASTVEEQKSLIVKNLPKSDLAKKMESIVNAFRKEIIIYRDVLKKFDKSISDSNERVWCTMVAYRPHELLILEDLKTEGFASVDRKIPLDVHHGLLVMKGFGSFHAFGSMELKKGSIDTEPISEYFFSTRFVINTIYKKIVHTLSKTIKQKWGSEWHDLGDNVGKCYYVLEDKIINLYSNYDPKFSVINHGDLWIPNTMFKYEQATGKPTAVKFLDFQFSHLNSFAWDISLFLFGAMDPSVRRKHWLELLETYHTTLEENMKSLGMSTDEIPSFEEVLREMNRIKFMTLLILGLQFALSISDVGDYELEKVLGEPDNLDQGVNFSMFDEEFKKYALDDLNELFADDTLLRS